jgi:hypothetical protein
MALRYIAPFTAGALIASPISAQVNVGTMFQDYAPVRVPQTSLPIGAVWVPGSGPSGAGADSGNLRVVKAASTFSLSGNLKQSIGVSLGTFLGLSADRARNLNVDLSNLEVHRIADLTALNATAGQQVLVGGIKAGTVTLRTDQSTALALKGAAEAKGIPIKADVASNNGRTLALDGSNLFLAYQVIELRQNGGPRERTYRHQGRELTIDNIYRFDFCRCGPGDAIKIFVQNLAAPRPDGTFERQTFTSHDRANSWVEVPLNKYFRGNEITAASAKVAYDSGLTCDPRITTPDGKPFCLAHYPPSTNYIRLITTKMTIRPVRNPQGSF